RRHHRHPGPGGRRARRRGEPGRRRRGAGGPATATVLVVNSGSSSIKYRVVEPASATTLAAGIVERIGEDGSRVEHRTDEAAVARKLPVPDHREGMQLALAMFDEVGPPLAELGLVAV